MKLKYDPRKADACYPITDAINAYVTLYQTNDIIQKQVSAKLAEWDLSLPQYFVILSLYGNEPLSVSELGSLVYRCNSNLTTLIDRMERDGLVKKVNSDTDRRVRNIRLSEKGRELVPKVIAGYREFLHQMMASVLTGDEQRTLIEMLKRIRTGSAVHLETSTKEGRQMEEA
jgi:DNA-binding MarR family transcriptional regulator